MKLDTFKELVKSLGSVEKAMVFVDGAEVTDSDGTAVNIETIDLGTGASADGQDNADTPKALDAEAIKGIVDQAVKSAIKDIKPKAPAVNGSTEPDPVVYGSRHSVKSFRGKDAEKMAFGFGKFMHFVHTKSADSFKWLKDNGYVKAQSGSIDSAGGALVPEQFEPALIRLVEEYGVFRRNSMVVNMTSDRMVMPRRTSGLTAYFVGESTDDSATALTKSSAAFTNVTLNARKLAAYNLQSSEIFEDAAVGLGDLMAQELALAFANKEDECGFNGDGTSTYGGIQGVLGFVGSASTVTATVANTSFATLDLADFHAVTAKLPQYAKRNARWYVSSAGFSDAMERLAYAGGGNTVSNIQGGTGLSFLGYPVEITQVLNSTQTAQTSTKLLAFGDLAMGTLFGDRKGIEVRTDASRHFDTDQIAVRGIERFDIACHTFNSTTTAGPVIVLQTPAS